MINPVTKLSEPDGDNCELLDWGGGFVKLCFRWRQNGQQHIVLSESYQITWPREEINRIEAKFKARINRTQCDMPRHAYERQPV